MRILVSLSSALASAETATTTTKTKKRRTSFFCHNNLSETTCNTSYSSNGKTIRKTHSSSKIASIISTRRGRIAALKEESLVVAIDPQHPLPPHHHHPQKLNSAISLQIQKNSSSCLFLATRIDKN